MGRSLKTKQNTPAPLNCPNCGKKFCLVVRTDQHFDISEDDSTFYYSPASEGRPYEECSLFLSCYGCGQEHRCRIEPDPQLPYDISNPMTWVKPHIVIDEMIRRGSIHNS